MILELNGTKVTIVDKTLGYQGDNLVNTIQVTVDKDSTWNYKLDMYKGKSKCFDSVLMTREGNVCMVQLTNEILSYGGRYIFQLRGYTDTQTYHSDIFESWVNASIEYQGDCKQACECDCKLPTEFYQVEDNVTEINNHPPYPGDNGKWMIWDVSKHEYVESNIEASGSGTLVVTFTGSSDNIKADHTIDEILQDSRDGKDVIGIWNMSGGIYCLPLLAKEGTKVFFNITMGLDAVISQLNIIGTRTSSDDIWELQMSAKDLDTFQTEANLTTSITSSSTDTQYPSAKATYNYGQSIKSLGITSAAVGDIVKVKAVDENGKPTEWEAAGGIEADNMTLLYHQTVADTITDFTLDAIDGVALSLSAVKISAILKAVGTTWTGIKVWIDAVSPNNDSLGVDSGGVYTVADKWYAGFAEAKFNNQVLENCICDFKQFTPYINAPARYIGSVIKSVPMFTYQNPPTIMTTPNAKINKIQIFGTFSNLEVMIWGQ